MREAGGDLQDESFCDSLVDQAVSKFGSLDILINNAAYQEIRQDIDDFSTEMFDRIMKTNIYAMLDAPAASRLCDIELR